MKKIRFKHEKFIRKPQLLKTTKTKRLCYYNSIFYSKPK
jgi:hypothetical protein